MHCTAVLTKPHWLAGMAELKFDGVLADGSANTVTATAQSYYQRLASISRGNVLNGDYIKLRQISLGLYTISEKALVKSAHIQFYTDFSGWTQPMDNYETY